MSLLHICVEIRSMLSCANVFLQFDGPLANTEFLKINVDADAICLQELSAVTRARLGEYFEIEARTMCNLTVEEQNASFRLSIKNISENFEHNKNNNDNGKKQHSHATYALPPKLPLDQTIAIHCSSCESSLTTHRRYARVLAYPTGSIDTCQFFCHHGPNLMQQLTPGSLDLFYGFHYIVVEANSMQTTTKTKESHVYCNCCLQLLGETLSNGKANKLWGEAILLQYADGSDKTTINNDNKLHNLFAPTANERLPITQLMQHLVHEATLGLTTPPLHFIKLCLETSYPNRQRRYLLIHILEQKLQVLRNQKPLTHGNQSNNNILDISLRTDKCFKLLYLPLDAPQSPILTKWQEDVSILAQRISPCIFDELLLELERNALLLPLLYRRQDENGFQPSYVFYDS